MPGFAPVGSTPVASPDWGWQPTAPAAGFFSRRYYDVLFGSKDSMIQKNVASQKWRIFAFDTTDGSAKTGDAAQITAKIAKDWAAAGATDDANPTETEDGYYTFDLTQAETNADVVDLYPESSTGNIQVIGVPASQGTIPPYFADLGIESDGDLTQVNTLDGHTAQTADHTAGIADVPTVAEMTSAFTEIKGGTWAAGTDTLEHIRNKQTDIETDTAEIGAAGAGLSALPWNSAWDSEVQSEVADALTAFFTSAAQLVDNVWDELLSGHTTNATTGKVLKGIAEGWTAAESSVNDAAATTTSFVTALTLAVDNYYNNAPLLFINGALQGQTRIITDYDGATKTVTFDEAFTSAPANSAAFLILAQHVHSPAAIVNEWETQSQADPTGFHVNVLEVGGTSQTANDNGADINAVLADTNELQGDWVNGGRLDLILDARASQTTADAIETDTQDIQSRIPAALTSGKMSSDSVAISGSTDAADKLEASAETIEIGTATGTPTTTTMAASGLSETTDDHYNGRIIIWTSGVLLRQATDITDYTGSTRTFTFTAVTEAAAAADTFVIV